MAATGVRVGRWRYPSTPLSARRPASYGKIELLIVPQCFYLVRDASGDCHWLPANKASCRGEGQSHLFDRVIWSIPLIGLKSRNSSLSPEILCTFSRLIALNQFATGFSYAQVCCVFSLLFWWHCYRKWSNCFLR